MNVTVVGEENVAAYAWGILEGLIDEIILNYRIHLDFIAPEDVPLEANGEKGMGEYFEEEEKKIHDDKSPYIMVPGPSKESTVPGPSKESIVPGPSKESTVESKAVDQYVDVEDEGIDLDFVDPPSSNRKETVSSARKEISPTVRKLSSCPCGENSDCWAIDNPFQCKVFALSGFIPRGGHYTPERVEEERQTVVNGIKTLGGIIWWSEKWSEEITHVIAFSDADMERLTEKLMSALAAGKWIVTVRFVKRSVREGKWICPTRYLWNDRASERRKEIQLKGYACGQLFWRMKAGFIMKDEKNQDFVARLVRAGGGKVVSDYSSIGDLINNLSSLYRMLTHIFVDDIDELVASRDFRFLVRESASRQLGIKFLKFKFIYDMISGRDHYLETWDIADHFQNQAPFDEQTIKRPQDSAGPSSGEGAVKRLRFAANYFRTEKEAKAPYRAGGKDGDLREAAFGKKIAEQEARTPPRASRRDGDSREAVFWRRTTEQETRTSFRAGRNDGDGREVVFGRGITEQEARAPSRAWRNDGDVRDAAFGRRITEPDARTLSRAGARERDVREAVFGRKINRDPRRRESNNRQAARRY